MRNKGTWVVIFFIAATLLVGYVFSLAFAEIFAAKWVLSIPFTDISFEKTVVADPRLFGPFHLSSLCGFGLAFLVGIYTGVLNRKTRGYISEVVTEIDKVAWPTLNETWRATFVVIVTSCIAAAILGLFDKVFGELLHHNLFLF